MRKRIFIVTLKDLMRVQKWCIKLDVDAGFHNEDSSFIMDAKTFLGLCGFEFEEPTYLVSDSKELFKHIKDLIREEDNG